MYSDVQYETTEGVATITIDRPSVANAFRAKTVSELNDALGRVRDDDEIYALVLTGAEGAFCAGGDITEMPDWKEQGKEAYSAFLESVQDVVRTLRSMSKPSAAAVSGPAVGAGCDFALACDLRVAGPDAVFREGFVRVGLVPGDGGAWLLPRLIGESKAKEYLLTGKDIPADEARELGLLVEISDKPLGRAQELASEIRDLPATAVQGTKRLDPEVSFDEHCKQAIEHQWDCVTDPEHDEAVAAMRESREPDFDRDYS
ncbi:enoyl-CoA hydratase/isomerase family protein [Natronomonas amylolytica]|uniref:enoyl-CoA hydratase/isomerase family protein n=1 Tax=Natronomonas amylolytica TaxID=3108498 RepID=UPI00300AF227